VKVTPRRVSTGLIRLILVGVPSACGGGGTPQRSFRDFTACARSAGFKPVHFDLEGIPGRRPAWGSQVADLRTHDRKYVLVVFARSKTGSDAAYRKATQNARDLAAPGLVPDLHTEIVETGRRVVVWSGTPSRSQRQALTGCL
jgi:hypothetical protein